MWRDKVQADFSMHSKEKSLEPNVLVDVFLLHTSFAFCLQGNHETIPEIQQNTWINSNTKTII